MSKFTVGTLVHAPAARKLKQGVIVFPHASQFEGTCRVLWEGNTIPTNEPEHMLEKIDGNLEAATNAS